MNTLNRRQFIKNAGLAGLFAASGLAFNNCAGKPAKRPNIIFLLTDDQRWDTMGCMGNTIIKTPNMDSLAENGVLFENSFVTTSICCASRATFFSGQYTRRHGIIDFRTDFSPHALARTYPVMLRRTGYHTGFIGKFGVGANLPENEFDYFRGFGGQGKYYHTENGKFIHLTTIMGRQADEFLNSCPKEKPFCLSISFKAPHVQDEDPKQFLYDPAYKDLYKDVTIPVPETADPKYFKMLPEYIQKSEARRRWEIRFSTPEKYQESVKGYYRLIYGVDVVIGKIRETLKKLNVDDNTVIILTGDNGFYLGEHGLAGKWFMNEESIRTPLIIFDPRQPQSMRGMRRKEMALNIDIAPTILDYAGVPIPDIMQGKSLIGLANGEDEPWRKEFFYEHLFEHPTIAKSEGVRTERWKYFRYIDKKPLHEELYDLKNDPLEENNLVNVKDYEEILNELRKQWKEMRESVK